MTYQVGSKVIHWAYGPGEIIQLDEKRLAGKSAMYYVVQFKDMTVWVPIDDSDKCSLRSPTPPGEFNNLFEILRGAGEILPEDRLERKNQLTERLRAGTLEAICRVIRDLCSYSYKKKLNDYDSGIMDRARRFLLAEWKLSLSVPAEDAQGKLEVLLDEGRKYIH